MSRKPASAILGLPFGVRQQDEESAALADRTFHRDCTVMEFHKFFCYGKTESAAGNQGGGFESVEALEDEIHILLCNSQTLIRD